MIKSNVAYFYWLSAPVSQASAVLLAATLQQASHSSLLGMAQKSSLSWKKNDIINVSIKFLSSCFVHLAICERVLKPTKRSAEVNACEGKTYISVPPCLLCGIAVVITSSGQADPFFFRPAPYSNTVSLKFKCRLSLCFGTGTLHVICCCVFVSALESSRIFSATLYTPQIWGKAVFLRNIQIHRHTL